MVAPAGFEPAISALRGLRPGPLDDGAKLRSPAESSKTPNHKRTDGLPCLNPGPSAGPEKAFLVGGAGFEPATSCV